MEEKKSDIKSILEDETLRYVIYNNSFRDFLKLTEKHKDIYLFQKNPYYNDKVDSQKKYIFNTESIVAFMISLILTSIAFYTAMSSIELIIEFSTLIIPSLLGGMFTILGLSLAGLAIITSTLDKKFVSTLIKKKVFISLIHILFNFYFSGFLIGTTILLLIVVQLLLKVPLEFNIIFFIFFFFITTYLLIFSTIYAIKLLGTCIKLFIFKYRFEISS